MSEIKRIDIKEFRQSGFLQEVNRQFFHPLGLALEVIVDDETGEETLGGIWDYRNDPEGMAFQKGSIDAKQVATVEELRQEKATVRINNFGWIIQPVNE